jgi:hypothetical protein
MARVRYIKVVYLAFFGIFMLLQMSVSNILPHGCLWYFKTMYQNFIKMTLYMIYIVALSGGFKCPRKIHLNTQW